MSGISVDALTSQYQQYLQKASTKDVESALGKDLSSATEDELMDACKQFEAYFIEQIYKGMQNTIQKADDDSTGAMSSMKSYYQDQLMQKYADMTSEQGGMGLAQQLYEQMKRNYNL